MEQLSVYEFLGNDTDPVLQAINSLKMGERIDLGYGIFVSRNLFNIYEISTNEIHESFKNMHFCYIKTLQLLDQY